MKSPRLLLLVTSLAIVPPAFADLQASATAIKWSFRDDQNRLSQIVLADRAERGTGPVRAENVLVQILDPKDPTKVIQTVWAKVAFYDQDHQRLFGSDEVKLKSSELAIAARGFSYQVDTSVLILDHDVVARSETTDLFCRSAVARLSKDKISSDDKLSRLERLEAKQDVRVVDKSPGKHEFDEVLTDYAIYEGKTGLIVCPNPIRGFLKGDEVVQSANYETPLHRSREKLIEHTQIPAKSSSIEQSSPGK